MNLLINYELISASGNPTAIIYGQYNQNQKQIINNSIFDTNKDVEQIGYIYQKKNIYYFDMMGDEFSGNGCRAAGYSILRKKPGIIQFIVSGITEPIAVSLEINNTTSILIPSRYTAVSQEPFCIKMLNNYQIISETNGNINLSKKYISSLPNDYQGVGIMYIKKITDSIYKLNPYFYTKQTDTLINETACGSGSTAVTIYLSQRRQKDIYNLKIIQPSGMLIYTRCYFSDGIVNTINISGPTKSLGYYNVKIKL